MGIDTTVVVAIPVHPKKGETAETCKAKAQAGKGAYSFDEFGQACWSVYGKEVKIEVDKDSIMDGFKIVNMNFNANNSAAASAGGLPGQKGPSVPASPTPSQNAQAGRYSA